MKRTPTVTPHTATKNKTTKTPPAVAAKGSTTLQQVTKPPSKPYTITDNAQELCSILAIKRPHGSKEEDDFAKALCKEVKGTFDKFGNIHVAIPAKVPGIKPRIMFSSHTDTVHGEGGTQQIYVDEVTAEAFIVQESVDGKKGWGGGQCLGADDGTGVWIMKNMIKAKIPGFYVFHRAEEGGGLGSAYIKQHWDASIYKDSNLAVAIAFDRKGTQDIITHQRGQRAASDLSANILKGLLAKEGLNYNLSQNGSFTDTANYTALVSECYNLSVGYNKQHGPQETQNLRFAEKLLAVCLKLDWAAVKAYRDPKVVERKIYQQQPYHGQQHAAGAAGTNYTGGKKKKKKPAPTVTTAEVGHIVDFITQYPMATMMYLHDLGVTEEDMIEYIMKTTGNRDLIDELNLGIDPLGR